MKISTLFKKRETRLVALTLAVSLAVTPLYGYAPVTNAPIAPPFSLERISIPPELGTIQETFRGQSGRLVIHLQDAHENLSAQESLGKLVKYFHEQYAAKLALLEGAEGHLSMKEARTFPAAKIREETAREFLKKRQITGPEYYVISENPDIELVGAETLSGYLANREQFLNALKAGEKTAPTLSRLKGAVRQLENDLCNKSLRTFLKSEPRAREPAAFFGRQIHFLVKEYREQVTSDPAAFATQFPELARYFLNEKKDSEIASPASGLLGVTPPLNRETAAVVSRAPSSSLRGSEATEAISAPKILLEITTLRETVREKLIRTDAERAVIRLARFADLLERLLSLKLTREEFGEVLQNVRAFNSAYFRERFNALGQHRAWHTSFEEMFHAVPAAVSFYQSALARDRVFADTALRELKKKRARTALLITGGYHTPGILSRLRESGDSYIVIQPAVSSAKPEDTEKYRKLSFRQESSRAASSRIPIEPPVGSALPESRTRYSELLGAMNARFVHREVEPLIRDQKSRETAFAEKGFGAVDAQASPDRESALGGFFRGKLKNVFIATLASLFLASAISPFFYFYPAMRQMNVDPDTFGWVQQAALFLYGASPVLGPLFFWVVYRSILSIFTHAGRFIRSASLLTFVQSISYLPFERDIGYDIADGPYLRLKTPHAEEKQYIRNLARLGTAEAFLDLVRWLGARPSEADYQANVFAARNAEHRYRETYDEALAAVRRFSGERYSSVIQNDFSEWVSNAQRVFQEQLKDYSFDASEYAPMLSSLVVGDLLTNAYDALTQRARSGEGREVLGRVRLNVELSPEGILSVSVEDNGIGIKSGILADAADQPVTTKKEEKPAGGSRVFGGRGIGLTGIRWILSEKTLLRITIDTKASREKAQRKILAPGKPSAFFRVERKEQGTLVRVELKPALKTLPTKPVVLFNGTWHEERLMNEAARLLPLDVREAVFGRLRLAGFGVTEEAHALGQFKDRDGAIESLKKLINPKNIRQAVYYLLQTKQAPLDEVQNILANRQDDPFFYYYGDIPGFGRNIFWKVFGLFSFLVAYGFSVYLLFGLPTLSFRGLMRWLFLFIPAFILSGRLAIRFFGDEAMVGLRLRGAHHWNAYMERLLQEVNRFDSVRPAPLYEHVWERNLEEAIEADWDFKSALVRVAANAPTMIIAMYLLFAEAAQMDWVILILCGVVVFRSVGRELFYFLKNWFAYKNAKNEFHRVFNAETATASAPPAVSDEKETAGFGAMEYVDSPVELVEKAKALGFEKIERVRGERKLTGIAKEKESDKLFLVYLDTRVRYGSSTPVFYEFLGKDGRGTQRFQSEIDRFDIFIRIRRAGFGAGSRPVKRFPDKELTQAQTFAARLRKIAPNVWKDAAPLSDEFLLRDFFDRYSVHSYEVKLTIDFMDRLLRSGYSENRVREILRDVDPVLAAYNADDTDSAKEFRRWRTALPKADDWLALPLFFARHTESMMPGAEALARYSTKGSALLLGLIGPHLRREHRPGVDDVDIDIIPVLATPVLRYLEGYLNNGRGNPDRVRDLTAALINGLTFVPESWLAKDIHAESPRQKKDFGLPAYKKHFGVWMKTLEKDGIREPADLIRRAAEAFPDVIPPDRAPPFITYVSDNTAATEVVRFMNRWNSDGAWRSEWIGNASWEPVTAWGLVTGKAGDRYMIASSLAAWGGDVYGEWEPKYWTELEKIYSFVLRGEARTGFGAEDKEAYDEVRREIMRLGNQTFLENLKHQNEDRAWGRLMPLNYFLKSRTLFTLFTFIFSLAFGLSQYLHWTAAGYALIFSAVAPLYHMFITFMSEPPRGEHTASLKPVADMYHVMVAIIFGCLMTQLSWGVMLWTGLSLLIGRGFWPFDSVRYVYHSTVNDLAWSVWKKMSALPSSPERNELTALFEEKLKALNGLLQEDDRFRPTGTWPNIKPLEEYLENARVFDIEDALGRYLPKDDLPDLYVSASELFPWHETALHIADTLKSFRKVEKTLSAVTVEEIDRALAQRLTGIIRVKRNKAESAPDSIIRTHAAVIETEDVSGFLRSVRRALVEAKILPSHFYPPEVTAADTKINTGFGTSEIEPELAIFQFIIPSLSDVVRRGLGSDTSVSPPQGVREIAPHSNTAHYLKQFFQWRAETYKLSLENYRDHLLGRAAHGAAQFDREKEKDLLVRKISSARPISGGSSSYPFTEEEVRHLEATWRSLLERKAEAGEETLRIRLTGLGEDLQEIETVLGIWRKWLKEEIDGQARFGKKLLKDWAVTFEVNNLDVRQLWALEERLKEDRFDRVRPHVELNWLDLSDAEMVRGLWHDKPADIFFIRHVIRQKLAGELLNDHRDLRDVLVRPDIWPAASLMVTDIDTAHVMLDSKFRFGVQKLRGLEFETQASKPTWILQKNVSTGFGAREKNPEKTFGWFDRIFTHRRINQTIFPIVDPPYGTFNRLFTDAERRALRNLFFELDREKLFPRSFLLDVANRLLPGASRLLTVGRVNTYFSRNDGDDANFTPSYAVVGAMTSWIIFVAFFGYGLLTPGFSFLYILTGLAGTLVTLFLLLLPGYINSYFFVRQYFGAGFIHVPTQADGDEKAEAFKHEIKSVLREELLKEKHRRDTVYKKEGFHPSFSEEQTTTLREIFQVLEKSGEYSPFHLDKVRNRLAISFSQSNAIAHYEHGKEEPSARAVQRFQMQLERLGSFIKEIDREAVRDMDRLRSRKTWAIVHLLGLSVMFFDFSIRFGGGWIWALAEVVLLGAYVIFRIGVSFKEDALLLKAHKVMRRDSLKPVYLEDLEGETFREAARRTIEVELDHTFVRKSFDELIVSNSGSDWLAYSPAYNWVGTIAAVNLFLALNAMGFFVAAQIAENEWMKTATEKITPVLMLLGLFFSFILQAGKPISRGRDAGDLDTPPRRRALEDSAAKAKHRKEALRLPASVKEKRARRGSPGANRSRTGFGAENSDLTREEIDARMKKDGFPEMTLLWNKFKKLNVDLKDIDLQKLDRARAKHMGMILEHPYGVTAASIVATVLLCLLQISVAFLNEPAGPRHFVTIGLSSALSSYFLLFMLNTVGRYLVHPWKKISALDLAAMLKKRNYRTWFDQTDKAQRTIARLQSLGLNESWDNPNYRVRYQIDGKENKTTKVLLPSERVQKALRDVLGFKEERQFYPGQFNSSLAGGKKSISAFVGARQQEIDRNKAGELSREEGIKLLEDLLLYLKPNSAGWKYVSATIQELKRKDDFSRGTVEARIWTRDPWVDLTHQTDFYSSVALRGGGFVDIFQRRTKGILGPFGYLRNKSISALDFTTEEGRTLRARMAAAVYKDVEGKDRAILFIDGVEGRFYTKQTAIMKIIKQAIEDYARASGFDAVFYYKHPLNKTPERFSQYVEKTGASLEELFIEYADSLEREYLDAFGLPLEPFEYAFPKGKTVGFVVDLQAEKYRNPVTPSPFSVFLNKAKKKYTIFVLVGVIVLAAFGMIWIIQPALLWPTAILFGSIQAYDSFFNRRTLRGKTDSGPHRPDVPSFIKDIRSEIENDPIAKKMNYLPRLQGKIEKVLGYFPAPKAQLRYFFEEVLYNVAVKDSDLTNVLKFLDPMNEAERKAAAQLFAIVWPAQNPDVKRIGLSEDKAARDRLKVELFEKVDAIRKFVKTVKLGGKEVSQIAEMQKALKLDILDVLKIVTISPRILRGLKKFPTPPYAGAFIFGAAALITHIIAVFNYSIPMWIIQGLWFFGGTGGAYWVSTHLAIAPGVLYYEKVRTYLSDIIAGTRGRSQIEDAMERVGIHVAEYEKGKVYENKDKGIRIVMREKKTLEGAVKFLTSSEEIDCCVALQNSVSWALPSLLDDDSIMLADVYYKGTHGTYHQRAQIWMIAAEEEGTPVLTVNSFEFNEEGAKYIDVLMPEAVSVLQDVAQRSGFKKIYAGITDFGRGYLDGHFEQGKTDRTVKKIHHPEAGYRYAFDVYGSKRSFNRGRITREYMYQKKRGLVQRVYAFQFGIIELLKGNKAKAGAFFDSIKNVNNFWEIPLEDAVKTDSESTGFGAAHVLNHDDSEKIEQVTALANALHDESPAAIDRLTVENVTNILENDPKNLSHIFEQNGRAGGFLLAGYSSESETYVKALEATVPMKLPYLYYMGVASEYRGHGVGQHLLETMAKKAIERKRFGRQLAWVGRILSPVWLLKLPEWLQDILERMGIPHMYIFLDVEENNANAIRLYEKLGFEKIAERKAANGYKYSFYGVHAATLLRKANTSEARFGAEENQAGLQSTADMSITEDARALIKEVGEFDPIKELGRKEWSPDQVFLLKAMESPIFRRVYYFILTVAGLLLGKYWNLGMMDSLPYAAGFLTGGVALWLLASGVAVVRAIKRELYNITNVITARFQKIEQKAGQFQNPNDRLGVYQAIRINYFDYIEKIRDLLLMMEGDFESPPEGFTRKAAYSLLRVFVGKIYKVILPAAARSISKVRKEIDRLDVTIHSLRDQAGAVSPVKNSIESPAGFGFVSSKPVKEAMKIPAEQMAGETTVLILGDYANAARGLTGMPDDLRRKVLGEPKNINLIGVIEGDETKAQAFVEKLARKLNIPAKNIRGLGSVETLKNETYLKLISTTQLFLFGDHVPAFLAPYEGHTAFTEWVRWMVASRRELSIAA